MAICKLSYPANSNVLETPIDFATIRDPILSFNETQLRTTNVLNNILLRNADLTPYPSLKARVDQGDVTDQEFADILIDNGLSLDFVQETFINDFPVQVDVVQITEIVNQMVDDGYERENIVGQSNPQNITTILALQDLYYNNFAFNASACASFVNPFTKLISVLVTAQDLASGISNIIGNINNVINDIKYFSLSGIISNLSNQLDKFQQQLIDQVDKIKDALLQKVKGIADKAKRLFNQVAEFPRGAYNFIQKKINQVKRFFSKENMEKIKNKIRKLFKFNVDQFEDLLPDVLNFLLLKGCGLSNIINDLLSEPVNRLQNTVDSYATRHDATSAYSIELRNAIKRRGGIRNNPESRADTRNNGVSIYNNANPSAQIPSDITQEERDLLEQINQNGLSGIFKLQPQVQNMGQIATNRFESNKTNAEHQKWFDSKQNYHYELEGEIVDAGWSNVKLGVWVRLIRAVKATQDLGKLSGPVIIKSAYRSPYYNLYIAGSKYPNSFHTKGEALDISFGNISTEAGDEFISQMARFGFGGISYYPGSNFTHFDVGPRRTWDSNGKHASIINSIT
jgi:uncharacterized protein YcbK (DUF882 family)